MFLFRNHLRSESAFEMKNCVWNKKIDLKMLCLSKMFTIWKIFSNILIVVGFWLHLKKGKQSAIKLFLLYIYFFIPKILFILKNLIFLHIFVLFFENNVRNKLLAELHEQEQELVHAELKQEQELVHAELEQDLVHAELNKNLFMLNCKSNMMS